MIEVTWEYGGDISWVDATLTPTGNGTDLTIAHTAEIPKEFRDQYGAGATGIGWEMALPPGSTRCTAARFGRYRPRVPLQRVHGRKQRGVGRRRDRRRRRSGPGTRRRSAHPRLRHRQSRRLRRLIPCTSEWPARRCRCRMGTYSPAMRRSARWERMSWCRSPAVGTPRPYAPTKRLAGQSNGTSRSCRSFVRTLHLSGGALDPQAGELIERRRTGVRKAATPPAVSSPRCYRIRNGVVERLGDYSHLDLNATAKGWIADRALEAAVAVCDGLGSPKIILSSPVSVTCSLWGTSSRCR